MKGFPMNIKNIICTLGLVSLGLVGCASTHPPVATAPSQPTADEVAPVPPPVPADVAPQVDTTAPVTVSGNTWSFVLPDGTWEHKESDEQAIAKNSDNNIRVIFLSQAWDKAPGLFPMTVIHMFQKAGGSVQSYKTVTVNGVKYVHVVLARDGGVDVGLWLGVKNKKAYGFMCGGVANESLTATCDGIASTLKIN
jgi:hypothetical protein